MTFLETAPARLALMAYDASTEVAAAYAQTEPSVGTDNRPCWIVDVGEGDYPLIGTGESQFTEAYDLILMHYPYGAGEDSEHELAARRIIHRTLWYFMRRPLLNMSNLRNAQPAALGPLLGVKWITLRRERVGVVSRGSEESFWGGILRVTITGGEGFQEVLR